MRRLLPGSLARQTGLVLALGMGAVLLLGLAVSSLRILRELRLQGERDEVDRLVPFAVALDVAPPELRARLYAAAARLGVRATEHPPRATPAALHDDWYTRRLRLRLAHELAAYGKVRAVAVGHPQPASRLEGHGPTVARLALSDGTTVDVALPGGFSPLGFLGETGPMVLVLGGGLIVLAVLVSRRVTRPLGDFASAAVRLGRDVNAPPLPEQGPSELRAVARAFNQMQQRLARLLEDRRHLLSAVSHDLRTPITRLRLRAEFIEDEAQRARTLDDLAEMEAMIASVLSLARDESVREPRAPLDLTGMVTQLCEELRELGHAVELAPAPPLRVTARPLALKRALRNLVENAAKYGGRAQLRLEEDPETVRVHIEDRGPGIPAQELERVFTPFYRVERSRNREGGGVGLGLTVARTILRGHGGDVTLANREGGGLHQVVSLPRGGEAGQGSGAG